MKLNSIAIKKTLFLFSLLTIFNSCDKDDVPQKLTTGINTGIEATNNETTRLDKVLTSETLTTNFSINVIDEDSNVIGNATVKVEDSAHTTNSYGNVLIENITINKDFQAIEVTATGYSSTIKTVTPSNNGVTNVTITLLKPTFTKSFSAVEGGVISNDKVSIEFPKEAIADQNGDLYEGEVTTTVTYYDPNSASFAQSMPGTLVGLDGNNALQSLISKGMVKVDLTDNSGNELELFEGKEAAIKLPASNNDPATIPFWHLNEEKGLWVQTSTATKSGGQYIAKVTHFSTYNLDVPGETIDLTVILKDTNNQLLANQKAILKATSPSGTYEIEVETDNKGEFKINRAPRGANYNVKVITDCEEKETVIGTINETITKELIISFSNNIVRYITLQGILKECNNNIWANKAFTIKLKNGNQQDLLTTYTDSEGKYSLTKILCNYNTTTTYLGEVSIYDGVNDIVEQNEFIFNIDNNIKDIIVCNGTIQTTNERIYDGNVILDSDTKYQEFISFGYTNITGYLQINGLSNTDLVGLNNLTTIGNTLYISNNNSLTSLKGLNNLTTIGGSLYILSNDALTSLNELNNLTSIVNSLKIEHNKALINLEGLKNITTLNGDLSIWDNNSLQNLKGLDNLEFTKLGVLIRANPSLVNLEGLNKFTYTEWSFAVTQNSSLNNINALNNLTSITINLFIEENDALLNLEGLDKLSYIGERLSIRHNKALESIGSINNLTKLEILRIENNNKLTSINGLNNLNNVVKWCGISYNSVLQNLEGINNLAYVGGTFDIILNESMISLKGLENLRSLGQTLYIQSNNLLTDYCSLQNLFSNNNLNGSYLIRDNALFNPSVQDIIDGNCNQ